MLRHRRVGRAIRNIGYMGLTAMIWPRFIAPFRWRLTHYEMPMVGLAPVFENYRILQISDLHIGSTRQSFLRRALTRAIREKPDLIVVTGDWIDYHPDSLLKLRELLPILVAPDGVMGIFGNHDYHEYSWRHVGTRSAHRSIHKRLRRMLADHRVDMLIGEARSISRSGNAIWVVGMDEMWVGLSDPAKAFATVPSGAACICLQHNPDGLVQLQDYPWQWMLCGHSHGGQVVLPIVGPLFLPMENRQWMRGLFSFRQIGALDKHMYVSCGLGYSAPLRLRAPPEMTLFTLHSV